MDWSMRAMRKGRVLGGRGRGRWYRLFNKRGCLNLAAMDMGLVFLVHCVDVQLLFDSFLSVVRGLVTGSGSYGLGFLFLIRRLAR